MRPWITAAAALAAAWGSCTALGAQEQTHMTIRTITPLLTVDAIEPCLPFWTGLGFEVTVTVPHEDAVGFAILARDGVQLMMQSRASIDADLGASGAPAGLGAELAGGTATLFIEVEDLEAVIPRLQGAEVVVPRRRTFYDMDEIFVRSPCGTLVGFAARVEG